MGALTAGYTNANYIGIPVATYVLGDAALVVPIVGEAIRQVGNYGEMWERSITPLGIQRGINNLWNRGGLHYAPPMR